MKIIVKLSVVLCLLAITGLVAGRYYIQDQVSRPGAFSEDKIVDLPYGSSLARIADELERQGVVHNRRLFYWYARLGGHHKQLQAGEYLIPAASSTEEILKIISSGEVVQYRVTLIEGQTFPEFRQTIYQSVGVKVTTQELSDKELMLKVAGDSRHPEGLFFPDTYQYTRGTTDLELFLRAYKKMQGVLEQEWAARADDLPYESPYEALIMASIVEKETAVPSEREQIAGVFVRRLKKGMRLQTDPTVIYGLGDQYKGNLTRAHLRTLTAYNTYQIKGLPPTPIAAPGREAIHAALHPAPGDALYFVAKGDGSHFFSASLDEHSQAVKRFQINRRKDYRSYPKQ